MKLSYCKFDVPSLKEEVFKMNRFNVTSIMRRLVVTMSASLMGLTIPAIAFKGSDYMLKSSINGNVSDFSGGVTQIINVSSLFLVDVAKYIAIFVLLLATFKFITSGDYKQYGKDVASIMLGYVMIVILRFMPFAVPSMMRAMGYL